MTFIKTLFVMFFVSFLTVACTETSKINHLKSGIVGIVAKKTEVDMLSTTVQTKIVGSLGTGFFIKENFIVTCYHVIEGAESIQVDTEYADKPYDAEVVFGDKLTDIAVIRIKDWNTFKAENKVTYLELADRTENYPTNEVMTIGHPWGLTWTVSRGIISSSLRRPEANPRWYIQTDANIFQGNSGGPLLTKDGKVLGISAMSFSKGAGSYGIVIPTASFMKVINDLEKYGEVRWPSMGILMTHSVVVTEVNKGSPAEKANLQVGDKIILVKSGDIVREVRTADGLVAEVSTFDYQDKLEITIIRNGQEFILDLYPDYRLSNTFESTIGD